MNPDPYENAVPAKHRTPATSINSKLVKRLEAVQAIIGDDKLLELSQREFEDLTPTLEECFKVALDITYEIEELIAEMDKIYNTEHLAELHPEELEVEDEDIIPVETTL